MRKLCQPAATSLHATVGAPTERKQVDELPIKRRS